MVLAINHYEAPGLTVVNSSIFGFTAIALGDGFLVPTHTTGGVYVMEANGGMVMA